MAFPNRQHIRRAAPLTTRKRTWPPIAGPAQISSLQWSIASVHAGLLAHGTEADLRDQGVLVKIKLDQAL